MRPLSLLEARVLGVLVEKAHTVPDSYPLSLNSLTLGCNQKTARDPVLAASEAEVQARGRRAEGAARWSFESSGSRVARYEHNMGRALGLPSQSVALLAVLMLRGPQTASELRANSERLHRFADISAVEGFLDELAARAGREGRPAGRQAAARAGRARARWAHLLCGPVDPTAPSPAAGEARRLVPASELAALKARVAAAEAEIDRAARRCVDRLYAELDIPRLITGRRRCDSSSRKRRS